MSNMADDKWYRRSTWTQRDREAFFSRLNRSRSDYNKAQYLRIQAYHLQTASPPDYHAALELLERMINEYPVPSEIEAAYVQRAKCLEALERSDQALDAYLNAVKRDESPDWIHNTDAPLHFAVFVIRNNLREHFNDVLESFQDSELMMLMPAQQYMASAAMAIIADESGMKDKATEYSLMALEITGRDAAAWQPWGSDIHERVLGLSRSARKVKWWKFWR